jgi:hypothetical protein
MLFPSVFQYCMKSLLRREHFARKVQVSLRFLVFLPIACRNARADLGVGASRRENFDNYLFGNGLTRKNARAALR